MYIFVYVTTVDEEEASKIAKHLLNKKLIACANFFPMKSVYNWEGKVNEDNEVVLLLKTIEEKFSILKEEIKKIHSYDTPCIAKIPVSFNEEYSEWLKGQFSE